MRTFISLDIPDGAVRESLRSFAADLDAFEGVKTVDEELLHATILFIGDRGEEERERIRDTFTDTCGNVPAGPFTCTIEGVGVFPHMNYIKVVWCGIKPDEKVKELHEYFREAFNVVNEREYVPHVTVGRVTYVVEDNKATLQRLLRETDREFGAFQATDVRLNVSVPGDDGVQYRELERCAL